MHNFIKINFVIKTILFLCLSNNVFANTKNIRLSTQQINDFHNNGILVIRNFFNKKEVTQVLAIADRLQQSAINIAQQETGQLQYHGAQIALDEVNGKNELTWIFAAGAAEPQLLSLSQQPKLLVPVSQLLHSNQTEQLINLLQYRFPNGGSGENFFQDIKYRKAANANWHDANGNGSFVLCLIALDKMNKTTGTIYYIPKSHLRGDLQLEKISTAEELHTAADLNNTVPLTLNPGDLVIWHPYLIHGNNNQRFTIAKRLFINGFAYPGANGSGNTDPMKLRH